jgi:hypothetical protein
VVALCGESRGDESVGEGASVNSGEVAREIASLELFEDPLGWLREDLVADSCDPSGACSVPARCRVSIERVVHLTLVSSVPKMAADLDESGGHRGSFVGCDVQPLLLAESVALRLEPAHGVGFCLEAVDLGDRSVFASDQRLGEGAELGEHLTMPSRRWWGRSAPFDWRPRPPQAFLRPTVASARAPPEPPSVSCQCAAVSPP